MSSIPWQRALKRALPCVFWGLSFIYSTKPTPKTLYHSYSGPYLSDRGGTVAETSFRGLVGLFGLRAHSRSVVESLSL